MCKKICCILNSEYYDILSCRTPYEGLYMEWRMTKWVGDKYVTNSFYQSFIAFISSFHRISIINSTGLIMKWKFNQWWSTIPPISTTRTITSHFHSLKTTNNTTYMFESSFDPGERLQAPVSLWFLIEANMCKCFNVCLFMCWCRKFSYH
jgi:hypothetical protein